MLSVLLSVYPKIGLIKKLYKINKIGIVFKSGYAGGTGSSPVYAGKRLKKSYRECPLC